MWGWIVGWFSGHRNVDHADSYRSQAVDRRVDQATSRAHAVADRLEAQAALSSRRNPRSFDDDNR